MLGSGVIGLAGLHHFISVFHSPLLKGLAVFPILVFSMNCKESHKLFQTFHLWISYVWGRPRLISKSCMAQWQWILHTFSWSSVMTHKPLCYQSYTSNASVFIPSLVLLFCICIHLWLYLIKCSLGYPHFDRALKPCLSSNSLSGSFLDLQNYRIYTAAYPHSRFTQSARDTSCNYQFFCVKRTLDLLDKYQTYEHYQCMRGMLKCSTVQLASY